MLKSRALPDNFDVSKAFRTPYQSLPVISTTAVTSSGGYYTKNTGDYTSTSPNIDSAKSSVDSAYMVSPMTAGSAYNKLFPSPIDAPETGSEASVSSPASISYDSRAFVPPFSNPPVPLSHRANVFQGQNSRPNLVNHNRSQVPHPQMQGKFARRTEPWVYPLRTSISCTSATFDYPGCDSLLELYNNPTFSSSKSCFANNQKFFSFLSLCVTNSGYLLLRGKLTTKFSRRLNKLS